MVLEGIFIASEMKIPLRGHCGYFGFGFTIQLKKRSNREKSLISEVFRKVQTVDFARHSGKFLCTKPTVTEKSDAFFWETSLLCTETELSDDVEDDA